MVMHQVRTLATLKGEKPWEALMLKRRRKTLVVCNSCNRMIHGTNESCDITDGEPYTRRRVSTVRGQAHGNLPPQGGKAPSAKPTGNPSDDRPGSRHAQRKARG